MRRRKLAFLVACAFMLAAAAAAPAAARIDKPTIRIGVLNDMSGPYADLGGRGSVVAAQLAVEDMGGAVNGVRIEIVSGDHQNKPDIGAALARRWFDEDGVDAIADVPVSSVALAVQEIGRSARRITLMQGTTSDLTGKACSPYSTAWHADTYALSKAIARAVTGTGGKTWFFIAADYAFGRALARDATTFITGSGGQIVGSAFHPLNAGDMASYLLAAQSARTQVVALLNSGSDLINSIKQANEFGIVSGGQKLVAFLVYLSDVHSIGLGVTQGMLLADSFYWDRDEATRAWSARFFARTQRMPTTEQAGVYASIMHYLKAVQAEDSLDADAVAARMRARPVEYFGQTGSIRSDGRVLYPLTLFQVKSPGESTRPWDYYKPIEHIRPDDAFRPAADGGCPLIR